MRKRNSTSYRLAVKTAFTSFQDRNYYGEVEHNGKRMPVQRYFGIFRTDSLARV